MPKSADLVSETKQLAKKNSGKSARKKVTRKDIKSAESLPELINKLVKRIKEGDAEIKEFSAAALKEIAGMDHGSHAAELSRAGAIEPLVRLLSCGAANTQCSAASALAGVAVMKAEYQKQIVAAGGGPALVALLKTGSAKVQEEAAAALATLRVDVSFQSEILRAGAIPALVGLLSNGSAIAQAAAAQATANAAAYSAHAQREIAKAGAIPLLLTLLGSGKAQKPAAVALGNLAANNREIQDIVAGLGGVAPLLALLNGMDVESQVEAAAALAEMARDNPETQSAIAKSGGIGPLLAMLGSRVAAAQSRGMACLAQLARNNKENQDSIARMDGLTPLCRLLDAGEDAAEVLWCAACAIMEITRNNLENQRFVVDLGGISYLAGLIKLSSNTRVKAEVAGAFWALSEDAAIKCTIAENATIFPLVQLLAVDDARATEHAACAILSLGLDNKKNQIQITQMLIDLLTNGSEATQDRATKALWGLVNQNPSAHDAIAKAGDPAALVELLKRDYADVKDYALWSLSLAISRENQMTVADSGGITPLIACLGDMRPKIQKQAAAAIAKLARNNDDTRSQIAKLGGVKPLIKLLQPSAAWQDWAKRQVKLEAAMKLEAAKLEAVSRQADKIEEGKPTEAELGPRVNELDADGSGKLTTNDYIRFSLHEALRRSSVNLINMFQRWDEDSNGVIDRVEFRRAVRALGFDAVDFPDSAIDAVFDEFDEDGSGSLDYMELAQELAKVEKGGMEIGAIGSAAAARSKGATSEPVPVHEDATDALANLAADAAARDEIMYTSGITYIVALLQTLGSKTKKFAAMALAALSKDHEVTQSAIAKAGAIGPLVSLLDGNEGPEAQEAAAGAILALADHEANRHMITESGGIGFLVMLLGCTNPKSREHAEGALVRLSIENANRVQIIKKLVHMLQDPGAGGQEQAAAALANLARESENNRQSIVDANGITPLLEILDASSAKAKENAVDTIKELCRNSKNNQAQVARAGGIAKLVGVLQGFSVNALKESTVLQLMTLAASAIKEMARDNRMNQDAITEAGAIGPLVSMLIAPSPVMQANAAGALANLARNHPDNQGAITKTGAVAPLCVLMKEGSDDTKDESAFAIWSLATNHQGNKDTIAKLGGIDPLLSLLVTGWTERSVECVAGALTALAAKHAENRGVIAKRLVGLLGSSAVRTPDRAERVLRTCAGFLSDSSANQVTFAKLGGIPPLIAWQAKDAVVAAGAEQAKMAKRVQAQAARSMLCLAADNATTQALIAKSDGIPPLIGLVKKSSAEAQQHAACALWHLASLAENRAAIVEAQGIKPLISMLTADEELDEGREARHPNELSALLLVRLGRSNSEVSAEIAEKGGVLPLVKLLSKGTPGAEQMAAALLAELALVSRNRDKIANAGCIESATKLLSSTTVGTPEVAARLLAHLAYKDGPVDPTADLSPRGPGEMRFEAERRAKMHITGAIKKLIAMLNNTHLVGFSVQDMITLEPVHGLKEKEDPTLKVGLKEQAAITLAEIAHDNHDMQDAIIHADAVAPLLTCIRTGSQLGQEHAARAIWHLAALTEGQGELVAKGAIPELVQLLKTGSPRAQEMAAAGLMDLSQGAVELRMKRQQETGYMPVLKQPPVLIGPDGVHVVPPVAQAIPSIATVDAPLDADGAVLAASPVPSAPTGVLDEPECAERRDARARGPHSEDRRGAGDSSDRLVLIADAGGVLPLLNQLTNGTMQARENAAGALWHLALEVSNQNLIAKCNGISPLVNILDDGTEQAHKHAENALARLAFQNIDNQISIAKYCVALLGNQNTGAQRRGARVLRDLAAANPGSPVLIVNAGAISPLVNLLTTGVSEVKEEAAGALSTLAFNSPSTQLAIASGLVNLVGSGSAEAQEQVTQLLLRLAHDQANCVAIAKAGAIQRLVIQLKGGGRTSIKAQELAAAVLSHLSTLEEECKAITAANGIRPLVVMLTSGTPVAQTHAAAVLSDIARLSVRNQRQIISENGIAPLVNLLSKENRPKAKAEAAGALLYLSAGQPATQKAIADAGGLRALVALLNEEDDLCLKKAAGGLAALCQGSIENQDAVEKNKGISKLVGLLKPPYTAEVSAAAAAALAVLAEGNSKNQDKVAAAGGIEPLVYLLEDHPGENRCGIGTSGEQGYDRASAPGVDGYELAKQEACGALWSLSSGHNLNQIAIAEAGGISKLVVVLGQGSLRAQDQAAGALAALALDNMKNEFSIAEMMVALLGSEDPKACAKAARAISRLARTHVSNQRAIANAGGIALLVRLLEANSKDKSSFGEGAAETAEADANRAVCREMASAIWSMAAKNEANQIAISKAGGMPPLIRLLLVGHPDVHRDVAGALGALASNDDLRKAIADAGGIAPLVELLRPPPNGYPPQDAESKREDSVSTELAQVLGAQEAAAGALSALAVLADNRVAVAQAGGIPLLVALLDGATDEAKEEAANALQTLVLQNASNQLAIVNEAVAMLKTGSPMGQEHVTKLLRNLAQDPENRSAIAKAGAVPELVRQLECGSERAMGMAASGLALIALKSDKDRATVTNELVKLLSSSKEAVRQRAAEALTDMAAGEGSHTKHRQGNQNANGVPLVNLLKDGLKDGRVEAQEYALRSLLAISDNSAKEAIVEAGCIVPLIETLRQGKLSAVAQEHAAAVVSGLAPLGCNALAIHRAGGIDPLVLLLSTGTAEAKAHAAASLAQLARRASAASQIAQAGAVSAFVRWLADPSLGPSEVAARALAEIALDNPDTQTQIAEEGAISPLVDMVGAWKVTAAAPELAAAAVPAPGGAAATAVAAVAVAVIGGAITPVDATEQEAVAKAKQADEAQAANAKMRAAKKALAAALRVATVAASALATLAKNNVSNQIRITEENGIWPLVELLKTPSETYEHSTKALWHLAANEENQTAIAKAGGIAPLVQLLSSESAVTAQYAAAALQSLAREHAENQIAIAKAGAIAPLVNLLASESVETQENAVAALLHLASQDVASRNTAVKQLVAVLSQRSATAQMKAAEALAVLAARSEENRKAITAANAIEPLVVLLGDGRRVKVNTPQERAAAVLADLARTGDNKSSIVKVGGVGPLVAMLSSDSRDAQTHAACAVWQLAALGTNKTIIVDTGAIPPLVALLAIGMTELDQKMLPQRYAAGALWHLASSADNKTQIANAGAIPLLVEILYSKFSECREHAAGVLSALARTQGGNKKAIFQARGIPPIVKLLSDARLITRKYAASALWGLSDGKDGVYDKYIAEAGAIPPLIAMLQENEEETRGFAVAALLCICRDKTAHPAILEAGGAELLQALSYGPATRLREQVVEMLTLLDVEVPDEDSAPVPLPVSIVKGPDGEMVPAALPGATGRTAGRTGRLTLAAGAQATSRAQETSRTARMRFHFFSFQIANTTGYSGFT